MIPTNTCIYCGSTEALNTSMTIAPDDGERVQVAICDEHAEDATVRTAKAAYLKRKEQVEEVMKQAAALGLKITPAGPSSGLMVATAPPSAAFPARTVNEAMQPPMALPAMDDDEDGVVVPTKQLNRGIISVGGNVSHQSGISASVQQYSSHSIIQASNRDGRSLDTSVLDGKAKVTLVEGRDGVPLAIPTIVQDGTGLTRMKVAKSFDDSRLQTRFKQMAADSRQDRGPDFRNEYDGQATRSCPICAGVGTAVNRGQRIVCPKCGGVGTI